MIFKMREFGTILESRELAARLSQTINNEIEKKPGEKIRIDFSGIKILSSFFAEEFIGGIIKTTGKEKFTGLITLVGLSAMNKGWIDKAVERRSS